MVVKNKNGKVVRYRIDEETYMSHVENYDGVCKACGETTAGGVEPDATGYECFSCGALKVVGMEEALLEGFVEITDY